MAVEMSTELSMNDLLWATINHKASDLHLAPGVPPILRLNGKLMPITQHDPLMAPKVRELAEQIMNDEQVNALDADGEVDFSTGLDGAGRFRCHVYKQRGSVVLAARLIPDAILSFENLGLPLVLQELCQRQDGLVLVTGPTGSGKSTTLAAMIDEINRLRSCVILTLEDPIEYLHRHKKSVVNQREIGADSGSFAGGLRAALRADPDVILVGEMRDLETIRTAITAAETGHLVFSTLHTRSAAETIDRITDVFPPHQQDQIRMQLASVIQAIISQRLLPRADGRGRVPAVEILLANVAVRNLIREGRVHQIPGVIETGRRYGMQTFDYSLDELVSQGLVTAEDAMSYKRHWVG